MRIRKHAKISSMFLQPDGAVLQAHVCQLNQSPWDVITFPSEDDSNPGKNMNQQTLLPPPAPAQAQAPSSSYQLDGYDTCAVNGTFYDSEQSITSMKLHDDGKMKDDNNVADVPEMEKDGDNNNVTTIMCCKNDGKGWQCSREAKSGHNLCEHHFAQVLMKKHCSSSNNDSSAHSTSTTTTITAAVAANSDTKIKQTTAAAVKATPSSLGRPHRDVKKSFSSDFYYYSGFGPLWGRKRGPSSTTEKNNNTNAAAAGGGEGGEIIYSSDSTTHQGAQSSFDYVEEEEDNEVENCKPMMKRARKPIKARSLKSLM